MHADVFRLLLKMYPNGANIKSQEGLTPYHMALNLKLDSYFLRLLLRAVPIIDQKKLCQLNYESRRMALCIVFNVDIQINIFKQLRDNNMDLLKHVIKFL